MIVAVRKRRGVVTSVLEFPSSSGETLRVAQVEYADGNQPFEEQVVWERECHAQVFEPRSLPNVAGNAPVPEESFDCVQRAARWLALSPFIGNTDGTASPAIVTAPLFGAIQAEDFQLVPLVRALQMPRVSLLLADDVGLGKSIEAGLVLSELIRRRRIRKVLVLCPAALRYQWQQELRTKFGLHFDIVDRPETHALRKQLGMDANPWRTFQRAITSLHYLKQPDVLEQFIALCRRQMENTASLPWDLVILDEAHNCMPSAVGEDSDLARMVAQISPYFEHRLFLTATPHNGYTHSFSGLLEQLDPVRFTRTDEFSKAEQTRLAQVVIRRLKSEVNETDRELNRPERFAKRVIEPAPLQFSRIELALLERFAEFRRALRALFLGTSKGEQRSGSFAMEILNKRLLSCPFAFADSWQRFKEGLATEKAASEAELIGARREVEADVDDDGEKEGRQRHASRIAGAWLQERRSQLDPFIKAVDEALSALGLGNFSIEKSIPTDDARFDQLLALIVSRLRSGKVWRDDERIIVFTEYKTTLDYLHRRLMESFPDEPPERFRLLYGGMPDSTRKREEIKQAFNDPADPVRILLATDAASEGQNLQETARLLLHWDVPWNPSRLDQRNGRLDRHGQARDVSIFHFTSEADADLKFLGRVLEKVEKIRTDLGSVSELFDAAFAQRFHQLRDAELVDSQLDLDIKQRRSRSRETLPHCEVKAPETQAAIEWLKKELGFSPDNLRSILETAFGMASGGARLTGPDAKGRLRLPGHIPADWRSIVDDELRLPSRGGVDGALPALVFDPQQFVEVRNGRPVFRPSKDTALLHLGHPLIHRALLRLSRARYPGTAESEACSRWTVRRGEVPTGADALIVITVEELANNELREAFHHWCRGLRFPIRKQRLEGPLPHVPLGDDTQHAPESSSDAIRSARDLWADVLPDVEDALTKHAERLTTQIKQQLATKLIEETREQKQLFATRQREVERELKREERDIAKRFQEFAESHQQLQLFGGEAAVEATKEELRQEMERHRNHHEAMKEFLNREEHRILEKILPNRFALRGEVLVLPVTVEIRLPEAKQ